MTCPPADDLVRFAGGMLAAPDHRTIEEHIDVCADCRAAISNLFVGQTERQQRFGRYRIDGQLGQGGMGIVFRAWDPQLSRAVAIKVVRHEDAEHRARLVREAQSLARLSHPHVCHVYDVGQQGDEVWFAMELIEGVTLRAWAVDHTAAEILAALVSVAEGLAAAHAADLVHRDVKPDNVLVDRKGRAVVTDFGLARILETNSGAPALTSTGVVFGSPGYMAPEQLSGANVDARADQFSWAVSAWELLVPSKRLPGDPTARIVAIVEGLASPPELTPAIGAALVRALEIAPEDRFASMDDLLLALRGSSPAVVARPRRRVALIAGASAVAVVGAIGIVIATRNHDDATPIALVPAPAGPPLADARPPDAAAPDAEQLPAGYRRLPALTGSVQVQTAWTQLRDDAVRQFPDAHVDNLAATAVMADGTVDFARGGMIITRFDSPSAFRNGEPQTGLQSSLDATGGYAVLMPNSGGEPRFLNWPRCTIAQIWKRAAKARKLPPGGTANITYASDPWKHPTWYFVVGPIDVRIRDDC